MSVQRPLHDPSSRIRLNRVRIRCKEGDRGSLTISSTLDQTYRMEEKTDEDISFRDSDLIAIKNRRESPCEILFEAIALPDGRRAVFRPSSQDRSAYTIVDPSESGHRSKISFRMKAGETIMLSSSEFRTRTGPGAGIAV